MYRHQMEREYYKPVKSVVECFKNPVQDYFTPVYDKYMGNPRKKPSHTMKFPMDGRMEMQMMQHRGTKMNRMKHHHMGRGGFMQDQYGEDMQTPYQNQVQRKLEKNQKHFYNCTKAKNSIWEIMNKEMEIMNNIRIETVEKLQNILNQSLGNGLKQIPNQQIADKIYLKINELSTLSKYQIHTQTINQLIVDTKQKIKQDNNKKLQQIKNLTVQFLYEPSVECFIVSYKNFQAKMKRTIYKAAVRQSLKYRKITEYGNRQQSVYDLKIRRCIASIGMFETQEQNYKDFQFSTPFTQVDIKTLGTLNQSQWLDNRVIVNVLEYLKTVEVAGKKSVIIFNHSQSDTMLRGHFKKQLRLTDYERVIFLINDNNQHWYVIGVFNTSKRIAVYDSMYSSNRNYNSSANNIQKKIDQENQMSGKIQQSYTFSNNSNTVSQKNGSDCGVCSIINVLFIFDDKSEDGRNVDYDYDVVSHLRNALYMMLGYFGYCKLYKKIIRKDFFSFIIRNTIYNGLKSNRFLQICAKNDKAKKQRAQNQLLKQK